MRDKNDFSGTQHYKRLDYSWSLHEERKEHADLRASSVRFVGTTMQPRPLVVYILGRPVLTLGKLTRLIPEADAVLQGGRGQARFPRRNSTNLKGAVAIHRWIAATLSERHYVGLSTMLVHITPVGVLLGEAVTDIPTPSRITDSPSIGHKPTKYLRGCGLVDENWLASSRTNP